MGTMGYLEQETPEHKNNYTSNKNKLKVNPENKTIGQSYQGLKTEGVRCRAEGQEEEEGKQKGEWEGGKGGGREGEGEGSQDCCQGLPGPQSFTSDQPGDPSSSWGLTFVLGSEFAHLSWEGLVELMLPRYQGLAQGCLVESENA